ncbi:SDR family NAD(P)-dependent oxidoreductase [Brevundimonas sp. R86498]|uniref:SDR family NAD(P)-dependent oxidoreductase n=1 Tax=Brevundimonas sp. R86498 TaxID=3093845 RepID=UPI0037CAC0D5
MSLDGRTILITGAAGAIGQACVRRLSERGARIMMTDRVETAPADGVDLDWIKADVTDRDAIQSIVQATIERFGRLDAVVLAAGVEGPVGPVEDLTEADLDQVLAVNLKGSLFALQAALPVMKRQGSGSIVALSSISGVIGSASLAAYTISKHAVIGLVRAAALEVAASGVRVNAVCPGPIDSRMMQRLDRALSERYPDRVVGTGGGAAGLPIQRYVTADEVARMIAFLCSDEAASCTGGTYMVDGGFTAK